MRLVRFLKGDPLAALLDPPTHSTANAAPTIDDAPLTVVNLPIALVRASSKNPRRHFDDDGLAELAESIRQHGIIEPLVCRFGNPEDGSDTYDLIAGERRLRAAKLAGLTHVPVRLLTVSEQDAMRLRLVENLQRVDLDAIDEALGYRALHDELGMTQAEIAKAVNRSQPSIANAMRVLDLPEDVVERIRTGELTRGHGVALAKFKAFPALVSTLAGAAVEHRLTVKELERPSLLTDWRLRDALRTHVQALREYGTAFDTTICQSCPFGAHVPEGDGLYHAVCLRPAHYRELQAAAAKARNAEVQRAIAASKAGGADVLKLDRMAHDSYERLNTFYGRPAACSTACPCYATALDRQAVRPEGAKDGTLVPICTDPKRLAGLRADEAKAKRDAARRRAREIVASLPDRMATIPYALDDELEHRLVALRRPLAVVASAALNGMLTTDIAKALLARYGVEVPRVLHAYQIAPETMEAFAKLKLSTLLSLTAEAVLRKDLEEETGRDTSGYGSYGKRLTWYLGEAGKGANDARD